LAPLVVRGDVFIENVRRRGDVFIEDVRRRTAIFVMVGPFPFPVQG
jgi:hypothetical protein